MKGFWDRWSWARGTPKVDARDVADSVLAEVRKLSPQPGDILVVKLPELSNHNDRCFVSEVMAMEMAHYRRTVSCVVVQEGYDFSLATDDSLKAVGLQRRAPCPECCYDPDEPIPEPLTVAELAARQLDTPPRVQLYEMSRWRCPAGCDDTLVLLGEQISCPTCERAFVLTVDPQKPLPLDG